MSGDPGLLSFACAAFASSPERLREVARALVQELDVARGDEGGSASSLVLGFAAGRVSAAEAARASLPDEGETMEQHALLALAAEGGSIDEDAEMLLATLAERAGVHVVGIRDEALANLTGLLDRRGSGIDDEAEWFRLGLPSRLLAMVRRA